MRPRVLLVWLGVISGACSSFGEVAREPSAEPTGADGGSDPDGASDLDAALPSPDAAALPPDAGCTSGCVLFADDFERPASDLLGKWTRKVGAPGMANAGPARGMVLLAKGGAGSPPAVREAFLEKTFGPRRDLTLRLQFLRQVQPDAGTFGNNGGADYCQLATVLLGTHRLATLYVWRDGLGWWLFQPDELDGVGDTFTATGAAWTQLEMAMVWTDTDVRVTTTFGTEVKADRQIGVGTFADDPPSVQVGYQCRGVTTSVEVAFDAVLVRSNP